MARRWGGSGVVEIVLYDHDHLSIFPFHLFSGSSSVSVALCLSLSPTFSSRSPTSLSPPRPAYCPPLCQSPLSGYPPAVIPDDAQPLIALWLHKYRVYFAWHLQLLFQLHVSAEGRVMANVHMDSANLEWVWARVIWRTHTHTHIRPILCSLVSVSFANFLRENFIKFLFVYVIRLLSRDPGLGSIFPHLTTFPAIQIIWSDGLSLQHIRAVDGKTISVGSGGVVQVVWCVSNVLVSFAFCVCLTNFVMPDVEWFSSATSRQVEASEKSMVKGTIFSSARVTNRELGSKLSLSPAHCFFWGRTILLIFGLFISGRLRLSRRIRRVSFDMATAFGWHWCGKLESK